MNVNGLLLAVAISASSVTFASTEYEGPDCDYPTPSHNGLNLLFICDAGSGGTYDIWKASRDGKNSNILLPWTTSKEKSPDWSPDDLNIVFSSNKGSSNSNMSIWEMNSDGSNPVKLTDSGSNDISPRYSPEGARILFISNRTGKNELWIMSADGSNQHSIALIPIRVSDPSWSPNGDKVVYVGCKGDFCNIFVINVDGSNGYQLTEGDVNDWNPDWGSDGIVFASNRDQSQGLWVIQPDGTGLHELQTDGIKGDLHPRWDKQSHYEVLFSRSSSGENASTQIYGVDVNSGLMTRLTNIVGTLDSGDVNTDGAVNCADLLQVKASFGKKVGQPGFNQRADVVVDGVVNIRDLAFVSSKLPPGSACK